MKRSFSDLVVAGAVAAAMVLGAPSLASAGHHGAHVVVPPGQTGQRVGPSSLYPDPTLTPGATNPDITQANLAATICNPQWCVGIILGREPKRDAAVPPELGHVGPLGMSQLRGWAPAVVRDAQEAQKEKIEPFAFLAARWRWNVYVTDPQQTEVDLSDGLLNVAMRLFESQVKEPFRTAVAGRVRDEGDRVSETWSPAEVEYVTQL